MKWIKSSIVTLALVAVTLSAGSLLAFEEETQDPPGEPGGGGGYWSVTCKRDPVTQALISKTCTTGGQKKCTCG